MSKSIEDYRNIVKVLKLQLLKVRQQNNTLSHSMGISSQTQTSSFTPRLQKYSNNSRSFSKYITLFTTFAHKCQLIGISPQMIFRIADQKRDKKVAVAGLTEIMKRVKLKMESTQIQRLLKAITKSGSIFYDQFLQYLSAFQINSEKYPFKSQRTYAQLCLLKLGRQARQKSIKSEKLYYEATSHEDGPYLSFESFSQFCRKNTHLKDVEIIAIFVSLDIQSECQVEKDVFKRQMNKIYNLLERGISDQQERQQQTPGRQEDEQNMIRTKDMRDSEDEIKLEQQTGVEAGNKQKKKAPKKQNIGKGSSPKVVGELKKQNIRVHTLISKLLDMEEKKKLIRPFSLYNFQNATQSLNPKLEKKKIMNFFKQLDTQGNGSISTEELINLWIDGRQVSDPSELLYKLLSRHLAQIQFPQPILRFQTLGYEEDDFVNEGMIQDIFEGLNLSHQNVLNIKEMLPNKSTVKEFCELLKSGGAVKKTMKIFKKMPKGQFDTKNAVVKKLLSKGKHNFKKYSRLEDDEDQKQEWDTIFTDQWACWDYCLQTASKLDNFWRDHEFGPTKGDPHGYRSIVGNESQVPPGLPFEEEIFWMTFEEMLVKQNNQKQQVKLMSSNLSANDVIQGKLGDCWLVSSLSIIASNDEYIKGKSMKECQRNPEELTYGIHPTLFHCFEEYGLYVFKFFKKFKPIYIVVDDLFPIQESSYELIFAKSPDPGLQWVAFLEKAYAKLHHCYSNLISGDISQGLNDFTNALPIKQDLNVDDKQEGELLQKFTKLSREKQLMGCSISAPKGAGVQQPVELDDERCGLFYGHAYSIGDVISFDTSDKQHFDLMRVRNPWGHGQWILDWSDKPVDSDPDYEKLKKYKKDIDKYYEGKIKQAKRLREEEPQKYQPGDDGEFLMNFEDFAKVYTNLFTGFVFKEREYVCNIINEKWNSKTPSGICKAKGASEVDAMNFVKNNHQYILEVRNPTDILMMLIQQDGRLYRGEKYPYKQVCNGIIILVFTLEKGEKYLQKFDMNKMTLRRLKFELRREVDYWHKFEPGKYAIIPCKLKNKIPESDFELRVYSEQSVSLKKVKGPNNDFKILPKTTKNDNPSALSSMMDTLKK